MSSTGGGQPHWEAASGLFGCLAAPLRVGIIALLRESPMSVGELVEALQVSQPLVSQHLRVLREHCLVEGERNGRQTTYRLMDDHVWHIVSDAIAHATEHDPNRPPEDHDPGAKPSPIQE